jgi:hypothetical protein|tara:strand:+ start:164 stop:343 length:180 start_codon:yes stop_codon:yes gene_type:complete
MEGEREREEVRFGTRRPAGADFCGPGVNSLSLSFKKLIHRKLQNLRVRASSKRRRRTET